MLVNTTIHGEVEMIVLINKAMKDLLVELMQEHCSSHERPENLKLNLNCGIDEYEHIKEVIDKIDNMCCSKKTVKRQNLKQYLVLLT